MIRWQQTTTRSPRARKECSGDRLKAARSNVNLFILCDQIYKLRKQGKYYFSPVRDDGQNAAFSVQEDGQVAIDHGTGKGFNTITLIEKVEGLTQAEARRRLIYYSENLALNIERELPSLVGCPLRARQSMPELCRYD